jgi:hypothetical protein
MRFSAIILKDQLQTACYLCPGFGYFFFILQQIPAANLDYYPSHVGFPEKKGSFVKVY